MRFNRFIVRFIVGLMLLAVVPCSQAAEEYVQVRRASVRANHAALAKVLATLNFAETVQNVGEFGTGWIKITARAASISGWVRKSALTKDKTKLDTEGSTGSASQSEMTLAGRGVAEAKGEYIAKNNLERALRKVEAIENNPNTHVSIEEMIQFLRAGNVQSQEGN